MSRSAKSAIAGAVMSVAGVTSASAQTIGIDRFCPADAAGNRHFRPSLLVMAALDVTNPRRSTLDVNGDFTETEVERLTVIMTNPCSTGDVCKDDNEKIVTTQGLLLEALKGLTIVRKRPPSSRERRDEPWLDVPAADGAKWTVSELLDPRARFLSVTCGGPAVTPGADAGGTGGNKPAVPGSREKPSLRITSKLEELTRDPGQDIRTIDAATLTLSNDRVDRKLSFAIDGIVGIAVPLANGGTLIPFAQYQRTSVRDRSVSPSATTRSPDKLALGAIAGVRVAPHDQIDVAPVYVLDFEKHSRVVSAKANWIPSPLRQIAWLPVLKSRPIARDLLYWGVTPRILAQGSHVFEAGTNVELLSTSDYLRTGADVSLDLWGAGPLSDFTASIAYKRLFRITKGPRDVDLLKANVQFWLDDGQHVSLGYSYERGHDEDTLDRIDDWSISLGVRF